MQAIRFHYRPLSYLLTRAAGRRARTVALSPLGSVRLDELEPPRLPGPDWVRVHPTISGICGSDLSAITAHDSFTLEPFGAYPFTFGHENVGIVAEVGGQAGGWRTGDRVVVNPMLSCLQRGLTPVCAACARGDYGLCRRTAEGRPGPGPMIGYSPQVGGGWSGCFVAHESQLHSADGLVDDVAVLTDPFATGLSAALRHPPAAADTVLILGAGTIGLLTAAALRASGWAGEITMGARHPQQRALAAAAGATRTLSSRAELYEWAASLDGARAYRPTLAPRFVEGGPSLVFDTVGTAQSFNDALSLTREGGRIVLLGAAARMHVDLTRVWYRQLQVGGVFVYGRAEFRGESRDIYDAALTLMREGALERLPLVTHRFALRAYRDAIRTALDKRSGAVKVVFDLAAAS